MTHSHALKVAQRVASVVRNIPLQFFSTQRAISLVAASASEWMSFVATPFF
jgi:hypothetical protein